MVDAVAAGLSERSAGARVSATIGGVPGMDAIRREYRRQKRSGQLPESVPLEERKAAEIREFARLHQAETEATRQEIEALEAEAATLGLELEDESLAGLIMTLGHVKDHLESLTSLPSSEVFFYYRREGISDPDEMLSRLAKAREDLPIIKKKLRVVRRLRTLRPETWGTP